MQNSVMMSISLPSDLVRLLDEEAKTLLKAGKPLSKIHWLTDTPEGRLWWSKNSSRVNLQPAEMNKLIHEAWVSATGGVRSGRPRLLLYRTRLIEEALRSRYGVPSVTGEATR